MKALLDRDFGIATWWHHDPMTGEVTIERVQDVEPYLEACKAEKALPKHEKRRDFLTRNGKKVMSIPNVLAEKFNIETGGQFLKWPALEKAKYVQWRAQRDSLDHFILARV